MIAKLIHSGPNEPTGFLLTTLLGIAGAFVATYLGQAIGWCRVGEKAGFIGSVVGAVIVLLVRGFFAPLGCRDNQGLYGLRGGFNHRPKWGLKLV